MIGDFKNINSIEFYSSYIDNKDMRSSEKYLFRPNSISDMEYLDK